MKKILIVDDSSAVRELIRSAVSGVEDMEVVGEAELVGEVISKFRDLKPDMILLDLQLPDGHGIELLRIAKRERPQTQVCMMSGFNLQFRDVCLKAGADMFINKCHGPDEVAWALSGMRRRGLEAR